MDGEADAMVPLRRAGFSLEKKSRDRSDGEYFGRVVFRHHLPEARYREAAHRYHGAPARERGEQLDRRVGVVEWQTTQLPVLPAAPEQAQVDIDHPQPPAVMQHTALRGASRSRSVVDC